MRRYFVIASLFFYSGIAWGDSSLNQLTSVSTMSGTNIFYKMENPGGTNIDRSISWTNLQNDIALPAANVSAGSLGSSVMASSVTASVFQNGISQGSNITITNTGNGISIAASGGGGGSGSLEWQLNGSNVVVSSTGNFSNAFTLTSVGGVATIGASASSTTLQGNSFNGANQLLQLNSNGRALNSNLSFFFNPSVLSGKPLSPGTTSFPIFNASTTTAVNGLDFDQASTQTVTWQKRMVPYGGGTLNIDFTFISTATSGNISWGYYATCSGVTHANIADNAFQNWSITASTSGAVTATAGIPQTLIITGAAPTCSLGDILSVLITRNHNVSSDAAALGRLIDFEIHEP